MNILYIFILLFFSFSANSSSVQQNLYNACDQTYQQKLINSINQKRAAHRSPPLEFQDNKSNLDLVKYSQEKANFYAGMRPYPPPSPKGQKSFGEIDSHYPFDNFTAEAQIDELYHTGDGYPFYGKEPPNSALKKYGTFTQMIWASSRKVILSCADAWDGPQGNRYTTRHLVAIFTPPGNVKGEFSANVQQP